MKNIRNESNATVFVFDIESFYPSILPKLLEDAINFAKTVCNISEQDTSIIMQARRTLLFNNGEPWVKKVGNEEFDVPMGCFDGAEICELVGIYNLHQLKSVMRKENVGLYRDDGLGILRNLSGPEVDRMRKRIIKIFKDCGLNITIKMNLKTVDFLDVRFDLINNTYRPFRKPNSEPVYIHKQSNHPPNILKELPKSINKRISDISCDENVFNNAKLTYEKALNNSGFTETFSYIKPSDQNINNREAKKKRKKKIIWYNPPFSLNVKTNVGKLFFKILRNNFPKTNSLSKMFNKNTVKISYSCTRNVHNIRSQQANIAPKTSAMWLQLQRQKQLSS